MAKLSLMDLGFFVTESDASPKHVGGLLMFRKPEKAAKDYVETLIQEYVGDTNEITEPFNQIIK
ncbi:MAG: wax ester/triacylglycerol synthase family O-acyltransferase, partial [Spongiibacteraceae bacterium]